MRNTLFFMFFAVILLSMVQGCSKDHGDPPVLPPAATMNIDFSNFEPGNKSGQEEFLTKGTETSTWDFTAGTALIWRAIIHVTLGVPVKTYQLAANSNPEYTGNDTWEWNYDATITIDQITVTYSARLTGQVRSDDVLWKMFISKEGAGEFEEFLWFEGTSARDGSSGQWILYESYQNQVPLLQIDWTRSGNSVTKIKYTYIKAGNPFANSYIEYGLITGPYDAYFDIHFYHATFLQFYDLRIEWNIAGRNGRVRCENHFGDDAWYCWDSNRLNTTCP